MTIHDLLVAKVIVVNIYANLETVATFSGGDVFGLHIRCLSVVSTLIGKLDKALIIYR